MIKPAHAIAISSACLLIAAACVFSAPRPSHLGAGIALRSGSMVTRPAFSGMAVRGGSMRVNSKVPPQGNPGTNTERTFIAIKPDGVQRRHVGEIIQRFETKGFKLVAMKLLRPTKAQAEGHYDNLKSKPFFNDVTDYFSSGPICAMVWEGKDVISTGRKMLGATNPADAAPGTIRGDLCIEVGRNICHGSDGPETAVKEIQYWFTPEEVTAWGSADAGWVYENPEPAQVMAQ
mmetsp:Transcript_5992/g.8316  ORF Transcript_5992/g.8316 Transcript_5992/m.8316 type:complete len:233 (-) Transcript_5992:150-848(-)|eukprot:CAMPEP_0184486936 /NCGR_PEP_ID=MMETSP0113_2-20130426/8806_1 /TAXON_ID=91329 /ORGANISM="Norrisiella sphaerica, Strain BC52" /LENGTH=232 /DNA_ID=CAMNT_0026869025 /DNA_START=47 /DNA_END=745 /DNA_ORIENTATION=+